MNIGLYFGTFNPVHNGHLIIANHLVEHTELDEVWMVVTPLNPLKKKASLLDNYQRYDLVYKALEPYPLIRPNAIEFGLPQPSYTVHTLAHLQEKHPEKTFSLIMGADNLQGLHKWKNHEVIVNNHAIYVYPRRMQKPEKVRVPTQNIHFVDAPVVEISSTHIRKAIKAGKNVRPLLPEAVWSSVTEMHFYKR
jgi:nicotinate-nucleotide adenylyltransferase